MKTFLLICLGILMTCPTKAAESDSTRLAHYGAELSVVPGEVIAADYYEKKWLKDRFSMALQAAVRYSALPRDSDAYAEDYGYPVLSANIKYNWNHGVTMHREADPDWGLLRPVDYTSRMGNIVTLYGTFERALFSGRRWSADYALSFGVGYSKSKYNTYNAIDNELIGSRWLIYFGAALHATWHFSDQWGLRAGAEFYHHSNGALNRPNKGANIIAPSLSIVYEPYYGAIVEARRQKQHRPFKPFTFLDIALSVGAKTLHEDWQKTQFGTAPEDPSYRTDDFKRYVTCSVQAAILKRYARRWASGVGMDMFHVSYAGYVEAIDRAHNRNLRHSPWSFGISAKHRAYYHNLSLNLSLGYYLYRELGENANIIESPYYEHIGLHYSFPSLGGMAVGINVKAHKTKADYTEFAVSCPIRL